MFLNEKRKKRRAAFLFVILAAVVCSQSGCGVSFCGFGARGEELAFVCGEEPLGEGRQAPGEEETPSASETVSASEIPGEEEERAEEAPKASEGDGKVDINSAGLEELMTLNGVGETRAKAIIEYRESNGPFQSKEDIMLIPGIKEGIYSKIKEQIAVH